MIIAKPVLKDQYWILKQDNKKIGEIETSGDKYVLKLKDSKTGAKTIKIVSRPVNIEFENFEPSSNTEKNLVHGYEVKGKVYNPVWDVKHRLPLFTREEKSKSWLAAGWYLVKQHKNWKTVQHPKLITLQRYPYQGPFYTKEQANERKN